MQHNNLVSTVGTIPFFTEKEILVDDRTGIPVGKSTLECVKSVRLKRGGYKCGVGRPGADYNSLKFFVTQVPHPTMRGRKDVLLSLVEQRVIRTHNDTYRRVALGRRGTIPKSLDRWTDAELVSVSGFFTDVILADSFFRFR